MKIKNRSEQDSISGGKNIKKKIGAVKRKSVPFLVVILVVTSALCYGQNSDCPSCIVGYWKMDETSGTLAHDSINGNHGGVFTDGDGMDPVWVSGIVGNALDFAGDAPDAVVIGDDPAYHFGTGYFALEAWIKYEGPTDSSVMYPAIMSKRPGPEGSDPLEGFCLCLSYWEGGIPGTLLLRIEDTNYYPCSTPVDDGEWHHVVVQRCQGQIQFYVNGQLDATATSNKDATTDADLTLGLDPQSSFDTEWEGLIDEVALYDCCLSRRRIAIHHEQGENGFGYSTCTCLYSSSRTMQMLTMPNLWDVDNPPVSGWTTINVIPDDDADDSAWGDRFPDLPWHAMYNEGAHWVYGNVYWDDPVSGGHEYYKIPLTVQPGNCVTLHFKAYVDDTATFYITGPGYSTPTEFYTHITSMNEHDPTEFTIDIDGQPGPDCLQPGDYTIYIDHWDTAGQQYGLIFTAECVSCPCCECEEWEDVTVTWTSPSGTQESWTGSCGETFGLGSIPLGTPIEINTSITCGPSPPCRLGPSYEWEVTEVGDGPPFSASGETLPISFIPTAAGWNTFKVELNASCDSPCTPCTIWIRVNPSEPCIDIEKKVLDPTTGELVDSIEVPVGTEVDFVITVCNCGTSDLESIKVVDYFFDCLEYLDSEASVTIDDISISGNQVTWEFGSLTLPPGDCFDIEVKAKVVSEGNCQNCVEVHAEFEGESISDKDCVAVTGARSGICLGSALLTGILALGVVVLNRKKE